MKQNDEIFNLFHTFHKIYIYNTCHFLLWEIIKEKTLNKNTQHLKQDFTKENRFENETIQKVKTTK